MFIGHYAPALIVAALPHTQRLGALFVAAQLVDIACFSLTLAGVEHSRLVPGTTVMNAMDLYYMPYTHSLVGGIAFAAIWAGIARALHAGWHATLLGALVVLSHWFLDLLVHGHDLTLAGGPIKYGLALWNYPAIEMPLEIALIAGSFAFYLWRTEARTAAGRIAPAVLALVLAVVQAVNWLTPQPDAIIDPAPAAQSWTALAAFAILALLATWVGRTRVVRAGPRVRSL